MLTCGRQQQYIGACPERSRRDADNRLTSVYTSVDSLNWDHDGKYFYYPHGPMARMETGHWKVQGCDYAYTLQGWIKGVNSDKLNVNNDMGADGKASSTNPDAYVGADAYAYSLGYFSGDYTPIHSFAAADHFLASRSSATYLGTYGKDLYNGNISHMITTLPTTTDVDNPDPQLGAYTYDQLNRIKRAQYYQEASFNITSTNNALNSGTYSNKYKEKYLYDENGNILNLWRWDDGGTAMDNMLYKYYKNGTTTSYDGLTSNYYTQDMTNRLAYVNDAVSGSSPTTDIESGMGSTNYTYDEIGQLTADASEEIDEIQWTVKNKVHKVVRTSGSSKDDLEFVYDAMGNRVGKIVKPHGSSLENGGSDDPTQWDFTYYSLDASGNVITVYMAEGAGKLILGEQHIYGSDRLGTHHRSVTLDNIGISSTDFAHRLGDVEYELKNHLGNVLVTVSDIPVPKDDVGSDNVTDAFEPNVLTAQDYTPFGTIMGGSRGLNEGNYRYGFDKQEQVDEISGNGNHNTALFWEYDTRLGRRWNLDPKEQVTASDYSCFGNNPILLVDALGNIVEYSKDKGVSNRKVERMKRQIAKMRANSASFNQMYLDMDNDQTKTYKFIATKKFEQGTGYTSKDKAGVVNIQIGIHHTKYRSSDKYELIKGIAHETGHAYRYHNGLVAPDPNPPYVFVLNDYKGTDPESKAYVKAYVEQHKIEEFTAIHVANIVISELKRTNPVMYEKLGFDDYLARMPQVNTKLTANGIEYSVVDKPMFNLLRLPRDADYYNNNTFDIRKEIASPVPFYFMNMIK